MKTCSTLLAASLFLIAVTSHAAPTEAKRAPFKGVDISGVYACVGNDAHDGNFASTMTVSLDRQYSTGKFGAFKVKMEVDHDIYTGAIVANGSQLALEFANQDVSKNDFGVALATLGHTPSGKLEIKKAYYEPQYMGGSNGVETCTLK